MIIPEKFDIGPFKVPVVFKTNMWDKEKKVGVADIGKQKIVLQSPMPGALNRKCCEQAFLHELCHMMLFYAGQRELYVDEVLVLYKIGKGPTIFTSVEMIMEFVQYGREKEVLEIGYRHIPLPLVEDSADHFQVGKAIEEMTSQLRGPFFSNLKTNTDRSVEIISTHLVDSVTVVSPFLELSIDVRFFKGYQENTIVLPLVNAAHTIRKQLMMSFRGVKAIQRKLF
jgi:hypothetical protein